MLLAHAPPSGGAWAPGAPSLEPRSGQMIEGFFPAPPAGRFAGAVFAPRPCGIRTNFGFQSLFKMDSPISELKFALVRAAGIYLVLESPERCIVRMPGPSGGKPCINCGKNARKVKVEGR